MFKRVTRSLPLPVPTFAVSLERKNAKGTKKMPRLAIAAFFVTDQTDDLPRKALVAIAAVVTAVLLITAQESLTVTLGVGVFVEVRSLRIVALPAAGIVRTGIKSVLITLVYGRLIVTAVPIAAAPILAVVT